MRYAQSIQWCVRFVSRAPGLFQYTTVGAKRCTCRRVRRSCNIRCQPPKRSHDRASIPQRVHSSKFPNTRVLEPRAAESYPGTGIPAVPAISYSVFNLGSRLQIIVVLEIIIFLLIMQIELRAVPIISALHLPNFFQRHKLVIGVLFYFVVPRRKCVLSCPANCIA